MIILYFIMRGFLSVGSRDHIVREINNIRRGDCRKNILFVCVGKIISFDRSLIASLRG